MKSVIWKRPDLQRETGMSRMSIRRAIEEDGFPPPLKLGKRARGWLSSEVEAWLASRPRAMKREG